MLVAAGSRQACPTVRDLSGWRGSRHSRGEFSVDTGKILQRSIVVFRFRQNVRNLENVGSKKGENSDAQENLRILHARDGNRERFFCFGRGVARCKLKGHISPAGYRSRAQGTSARRSLSARRGISAWRGTSARRSLSAWRRRDISARHRRGISALWGTPARRSLSAWHRRGISAWWGTAARGSLIRDPRCAYI
jgi:hypothetical protein